MKKKILLNWLPPSMESCASPALSVLKPVLEKNDYEVEIYYWNLSLYSFLKNYFNFGELITSSDTLRLLPFYVHLSIKYDDHKQLDKLAYYVLANKPQLHRKGISYIKSYFFEKDKEFLNTIDCELSKFNLEDYLYIGFSSQLYQWIPASIIADEIKTKHPGIKLIMGGFGTKNEALSFMNNFTAFDFASWGEGETSLLLLSQYLENQKKIQISNINNTIYRELDSVVCNTGINTFSDLNNLYFDVSDYFQQVANVKLDRPISIPVEGSRSCHWHKCNFCFLNSGYKYRTKSIKSIVNEIYFQINKYEATTFLFLDNDIIGKNMDVFDSLLDGFISIKEKHNDFNILMAEIVTKDITYDVIKKMSIVNFQTVQIGYESPSANLLNKINKKNTFASNLFFIKWATKFGILVNGANVLRNLPEETDEDIREGISNLYLMRFYLSNGYINHSYSYLSIAKSSRYFNLLKNSGTLDEWNDSSIYKMLPENYVNEIDKYTLFLDFIKPYHNPLWDNFEAIEKHYLNSTYQYDIYTNDESIYYRERYNSLIINEIEFNNKDIHWRILQQSNKKIVCLDDLIISHDNTVDRETIINAIIDLRNEGLLYCNDDMSEIFSIINTDNIN